MNRETSSSLAKPPQHPPCLIAVACLVMASMICGGSVVWAQLPKTNLSAVFPTGGQSGTSSVVAITGGDLDEVDALIFSHPDITAAARTTPATTLAPERTVANQFLVKIPRDVPTGIYEVRAVGRFGVSNPRRFHVGSHPELHLNSANHDRERATPIEIGTTIGGRAEANAADYYKFHLNASQRVIIDCFAKRIDSKIIPTVVVYDASGRELKRCRDAVARDPVLDFTAPADGDFILGINDFLHRGGSDYPYRVVVHEGPHVDYAVPASGTFGEASRFTLFGRNLPGGKPDEQIKLEGTALETVTVDLFLPEPAGTNTARFASHETPLHGITVDKTTVRLNTERGQSNPISIFRATGPVTIENEPNDAASQANQIRPPCEFVGQFYPAGDLDWIEFQGRKGESYRVEVLSHRLGVDTDPAILLQQVVAAKEGASPTIREITAQDDSSDRNRRIGANYDTSTDDPTYRFSVPADATYRIAVHDQFNSGRADPRRIYRLAIRGQRPDFRILATPATPISDRTNQNRVSVTSTVIRRGGSAMLDLNLLRIDGFDGEVAVSIEGLPDGISCPGALIGGAASRATLVLSADMNAPAWSGVVRVVGCSEMHGRQVVREATGGSVVWSIADRRQEAPRFRATQDLVVSLVDCETSVARIQAGPREVWETAPGGKLEIPVSIERRNGFNSAFKLTALGLPGELKVKDVSVAAKVAKAKLAIDANNTKLQPGVYTFCMRGDTKFKYSRNQDAVKRAETEQQRLNELLQQFSAKAAQAEKQFNALDQAHKTAQQAAISAASERQLAQQTANAQTESAETAADLKLEQAENALDSATRSRAEAEQTLAEARRMVKQASELKKTVEKNLKDQKSRNKAVDVTDSLYSTPIMVRVVKSPITLQVNPPTGKVEPGSLQEISVNVKRRFGFDGNVQIELVANDAAKGLDAPKVTIPSSKSAAVLKLNATNRASTGEREIVIRAQTKFNSVTAQSDQSVRVEIGEPGS